MTLNFGGSSAYIRHLEEEIAYLRGEVKHERDRAEAAINVLLASRQHVPVVAHPEPVSTIADIYNSPEVAMMGDVDGVDGLPRWGGRG